MADIDAKSYREAVGLMDDPEVDDETRKFLQEKASAFEKSNPKLASRILAQETGDVGLLDASERIGQGPTGQLSFGESGLSALKRAGFNKPLSTEEYSKKRSLLRGHAAEKKELTELGQRRETYVQPTTMPEETADEIQAGLQEFEAESPELVPPEPPPGTMVIGPEGASMAEDVPLSEVDQIDLELNRTLNELGSLDIDEKLPSSSGRKDLYADPEFMPEGAGLTDLIYAERFYEPPLELAKAALRTKLGAEAEDVTEKDPAYHRFADAMWKEARAKAEANGRPIVRVAHMTNEKWKRGNDPSRQVNKLAAEAMPRALALQLGAGKSLTAGVTGELTAGAMSKIMGRDVTREFHDIEERHPVLSGGGMVLGAMTPGGLANRAFTGLAGKAPSSARAALAGAGTGAGESVAQDLVHNAGEAAFARDPRMVGNIGERAMGSSILGAGGGVFGNILGDIAAARVRAVREGSLGPDLARMEAGGVETGGLSGVKLPEGMQAAARQGAQQGRQPVDVMLERVKDPIAAQAFKEQLGTIGAVEAEKGAILGGKVGKQKPSAAQFTKQLKSELGRLFDDTGRQLPMADADRRALGKLAEQTLEIRVVPKAQAAAEVRKFGGGGMQVKADHVARLLNQAPELEGAVADAQRQALAKGGKPTAKRGRKKEEYAEVRDDELIYSSRAPSTEPGFDGDVLPDSGPPTLRNVDAAADTEPDLGDTILPPPPSRGTLRSPPFDAPKTRTPSIEVKDGFDPTRFQGVTKEEGVGYAVDALEDFAQKHGVGQYVYIVGPRKMTPQQYQDTIGRVADKIKDDRSTDLFKRLEGALMTDRSKIKGVSAEPVERGGKRLEGYAAKNADWEQRFADMEKRNRAVGLPARIQEETVQPGEARRPRLSADEDKSLTGSLKGYGSGAGRELADSTALDFARGAGKEQELQELGAYLSSQRVAEKSRLRGVVGMSANPSLYSASPGETLALRSDPAMRSLSKQIPRGASISAELQDVIRKILKEPPIERAARGPKGRQTPMEDLRTGATGMLSARQFGPGAAAGHKRRERVFIKNLSPKERDLLLRLVEASQKTPERKAASGE